MTKKSDFVLPKSDIQGASNELDFCATSPPSGGYSDFPPAEKNPWFINSDMDPGPAVHTLNVFICSKKGNFHKISFV